LWWKVVEYTTMPAAIDFRLCPACETRNKDTWEYCVRCGEPLTDVTLVSEAPDLGAGVRTEGVAPPPAAGFSPLVWLLLIGAAVGGWYVGRNPPAQIDPGVFTAPAPPGTLPTAVSEPESGEASLGDGRRLLRAGDAHGAIERLAQAVATRPDDPSAHFVYAQALLLTGSPEEAIGEYREAVSLSPRSYAYHSDLARLLATQGDTEEAVEAYRTALGEFPDSPALLRELALLHAKSGTEDPLPLLERAADLVPDSVLLRQDVAFALEQAGRAEEAREAYRLAIETNPRAALSRSRLAELLFDDGQTTAAIELMREGVTADPTIPLNHRQLASLLERSGRLPEAVAAYRAYIRLAPNAGDAKGMARRAEVLEQRGSGTSS
jgi:tetratricopeptide (TPR) repeat protein